MFRQSEAEAIAEYDAAALVNEEEAPGIGPVRLALAPDDHLVGAGPAHIALLQAAAEGDSGLVMFVVAHGPVQGVDSAGQPGGVIDNDLIYEFAKSAGQHHHLRRR